MTSPATKIILEYVAPGLGVITCNLVYLAPVRDLKAAVAKGAGLQSLNPTPWAFMLGMCLGWTVYGILKNDWFLFWSCAPGFLISFWLNLGAVKLQYSAHHQRETRQSLVTYLAEGEGSRRKKTYGNSQWRQSKALWQERSQLQDDIDSDDDNAKSSNDEGGKNEEPQNEDKENVPRNENGDFSNSDVSAEKNEWLDTISDQGNQENLIQEWRDIVWDVTSQKTQAKTPHDRVLMMIVVLWSVVLSGIGFYGHYPSVATVVPAQVIIGWVVNINQIFFYGAPLSTIRTVISTKKSDTLHLPTMAMNTLSTALWLAYGLAPQINDPFVYVPSALAVFFGIIQFILRVIFPKSKEWQSENNQGSSLTSMVSSAFLRDVLPMSAEMSSVFKNSCEIYESDRTNTTATVDNSDLEAAIAAVKGTS